MGQNTPKTLEARCDFNGTLLSQANAKPPFVVYNRAGSRLYAAPAYSLAYIDSTLYRVSCASVDEANFLAAVLNCDFLQPMFTKSKGGTRDYHTYFWWDVPIPRFNKSIALHNKLARLAESAASKADLFIKQSPKPTRQKVTKMLHDESIMSQINSAVKQIMSKPVAK